MSTCLIIFVDVSFLFPLFPVAQRRRDHRRTRTAYWMQGGDGNTHVTCHVGVPSCGQRQRNVFIT